MNENIFRAYDIRGIYPKEIDEEFAERLGRAYGKYIGPGKKVVVGRDLRVSGEGLSKSLAKGILSTGVDITDAGEVPTPLLSFAVPYYGLAGGVAVSASHNPPEWNGFKMFKEDAYVISLGTGLETLKEMVKLNSFQKVKNGTITDKSKEIMKDYLGFLSGKVEGLEGLAVGIDPGNGSYSGIATETLGKKGAVVTSINDTPDGTFPSRSPEPKQSSITGLISLVKEAGLDMGVAFDADGDRSLFVTDTGTVVQGDLLMALLVKEYLKKGEKVAYEVSCSKVVEDMIKEKGGVPILTRVGYTNLRESMKRKGCRFGCEISGHVYFAEIYGSDDGLFTALKTAEMLAKSSKSFSELLAGLPKYVDKYEEFQVNDAVKQKVMDSITTELKKAGADVDTFEGTKVRTPKGWYLLRMSNTSPLIRCRAEAKDNVEAEMLLSLAKEQLEAAIKRTK